MDELITTVVPTYRRPQLLRRAVVSALSQSYGQLKVCVFDNASGDETEEVVSSLIRQDARVSYIKNERNVGAVANMMRGAASVSTGFYSFLNDDDFLLPNFYQNAMNGIRKSPRVGFVCAKTVTVDIPNRKLQLRNSEWQPRIYEPSISTMSKMYRSHFTQTGVLFRQEMRQLIGLYEKSGNDILYMTMAAATASFLVLDSCGGAFTIHPQSYTSTGGISQERLVYLYEALISTLSSVIKMNLADDMKVHLLSLISNYYYGMFELKRLAELKAENDSGSASSEPLPSRVTFAGVLCKLHERFPRKRHALLAKALDWLTTRSRRAAIQTNLAGWSNFPNDAHIEMITVGSSNLEFAQFLQQFEQQVSKLSGA